MIGGFQVEIIDEVINELENNMIIIISPQPQASGPSILRYLLSTGGICCKIKCVCVQYAVFAVHSTLQVACTADRVPLCVALAGLALHSWV